MKSGFYMTTGNNQLSGWTEKLQSASQSQTYTKKWWWSLFWWSALSLIQHSFLNPGETVTSKKYAQQIDEIHWKIQCLQPALVNRMDPNFHEKTQQYVPQGTLQKLNELGYEVLPHLPYSLDLLPTGYHFVKHLDKFLQGKHFHNRHETEKCFPRVPRILKHNFYATGINKPISRWQQCVDFSSSYFSE